MTKITYLFGAGASAGCLPVVDKILPRLELFKQFMSANARDYPDNSTPGQKPEWLLRDFLTECDSLIEQTKAHASIDTYAKKLRITGAIKHEIISTYNIVKVIMSCFFIYEQLVNKPDKRYDSFFASILGKSDTDFPENVRILSWNYDFQFERSYSEYSLSTELTALQNKLKVIDAYSHHNHTEGFGIFKLNGTTSFIQNGVSPSYWNPQEQLDGYKKYKLIYEFLKSYDLVRSNSKVYFSNISFAWEATWNERIKSFLELAEKAVSKTDVLVVIGYSFPFFNRLVDKRMLNSVFKKVYIQDLHPEDVEASFRSVLPVSTHPVIELIKVPTDPNRKSQFFLPPEL